MFRPLTCRALRVTLPLVAALLAPACTERIASRDGGDPGDVRLSFPDGAMPDAPRADAPFERPDAGPSSGLVCEPCSVDDDCGPSAYCVELRAGESVCLTTCDPDLAECPADFDCFSSLIRPRAMPVCTPVGSRCCVDADGDDYGIGVGCDGPDCDDATDSTHAGAVETCNGIDDDCDGTIDDDATGIGVVCSTGMTGACSSGVTTCTAGAFACAPDATGMAELCNGIDDDCDGRLDESAAGTGAALTEPCYGGPAGTEGRGICTAGARSCVGGVFSTCIGEILPAAFEACNNVDDDCDGMIDDGNPGGGLDCATGFIGACGAGRITCVSGVLTCRPISAGSTEVCDAEDNDCDGMLNEGFPGLGTACTSGMGTCRVGGVTVCNPTNPAGAPVCNAVPSMPSPMERCDYVDDDCDGVVDDGFVGASGRYDTTANCGACGFDCSVGWAGGPAAVHVTPTCDASTATPRCSFTCVAGWGDADGVRENGCEFPIEADTIYVSTPANGGADASGCGTLASPCASIGGGLLRAVATSARRVRVSTGLFVENVTLVNGISVLGGHSANSWARDPAVFPTTIRGADAAVAVGGATDRITVVADGITSATELSGFTITSINGGAGGNSIAVWVRNSDNDFVIRDNDIIASSGGNGATGSAGTPGTAGAAGGPGIASTLRTGATACTFAATTGPAGAATSCGGVSVAGGRGGSGLSPQTSGTTPTRSGPGVAGLTAALGGAGGASGYNLLGDIMGMRTQCLVLMSPTDPTPGAVGMTGTDGAGGAGAASGTGSTVANHWRGAGGASGLAGTFGGGGGGGGSPGGVDARSANGTCLYPPTGGAGGSGGCGGTAASGGQAGGGSFGIFIALATTPTAATFPTITANSIRRGTGGRGGDGGTGGGGGSGGLGGAGGDRLSSTVLATTTFSFCLSFGAAGGAGGRGGHGGGGGGGAGGVSYDIWVSRPGAATPTYSTTNTFEVPAATDTGGDPGIGGNSSNTTIGLGTAGVGGTFGAVRVGT